MTMEISTKFGEEMKQKEFTMQDGVTFINHGSYGVVPRRVQEAQRRILEEMNNHPDIFFRHNLRLQLDEARKCIANFVHADPEDLVFVQNATTGINTVLKSLKLESGEILLCTDNSYLTVKHTCEALTASSDVKDLITEYLPLKFPITTEDDVVNWYRDYFKRKPNVKLAVIDHITSPSAIKMPIENLIPLCREFGVLSLIDGAHAPGQIPLNLQQLDADFYTGNLHKWLYAPRGCAILYINKRHQNWVKPLVTSHGYKTNFHTDFFHQGTRDDTPYLSVPSAIKFYNDIGGNGN